MGAAFALNWPARNRVTASKRCLTLFNYNLDEFCNVSYPWTKHGFITRPRKPSSNETVGFSEWIGTEKCHGKSVSPQNQVDNFLGCTWYYPRRLPLKAKSSK